MALVDKYSLPEEDISQNVRDITNQVDTSNINSVPLSMYKPKKKK